MMKKLCSSILCISVIFFPHLISAQETMKMSYWNHYPHSYDTGVSGRPAGAAVRYVETVAEKMGVKVKWVGPRPYKRLYRMNKEGSIDGYPIEIKENIYMKDCYFTDKPYHSVETILALKKDHHLNEIRKGDDIKGLRIGWVDENYFSPFMLENKHNVTFEFIASDTQWVQHLKKLLRRVLGL